MFEQRNLKADVAALILLAAVAFTGLALLTYSADDPPGKLVYPQAKQAHNACGPLGAALAHWMLQGFGVGAYFVLVSAGVLDALMLRRRKIGEPVLRMLGWLCALVGLSTLAALALPAWSGAPVIGPGGYLGATGRGWLEMHFKTAGSYIITISLLQGGLLLCTDYALVRMVAHLLGFSLGGAAKVKGKLKVVVPKKAAPQRKNDVDDDLPQGAMNIRIGGKTNVEPPAKAPAKLKAEVAKAEPALDDEDEEDKPETEEASADDDPADSDADSEGADETPAKAGVGKRLASALRIKVPGKLDRDAVMQELDAASRTEEAGNYELPPIDMLMEGETICFEEHEKDVRRKAKILEKTFANFGFKVKVVEIETGPVIAQFEIELEAGLRLSKITSLADDLAIALRVPSVRIVAPIPGKNTVGIEVPNNERQLVRLREVIEESNNQAQKMRIPIFLGKDVSGKSLVVDLSTLPHLLIAGRTGTGKSVCLNTIIVSMLMTRRPDEVRMLMIDPKMVELSPYKRLPHLMHPVVTDMKKAEAILAWAVEKMEERYALLARAGVRHIGSYNQLGEEELMDRLQPENDEERKSIPLHLPYIVIVADEMADLMMTSAKEVEQHIIRLAQKSRAVGIHLVLATQKPTVDVITGLIKSNLPARIAFQVASRTDSRVVLDEMGADKLLGNGDMLFLWPGTSMLLRGQGTYVGDDEITRVVDFVGTTEPEFVKELVQLKTGDAAAEGGKLPNRDELYESAVDLVVREGRGSVSLLQRALGIGYGRAARLVDYMAEDNIVGTYNGSQAREVLITIEQWEAMQGNGAAEEAPSPSRSNRVQLSKPSPQLADDSDEDDEYSDREADESQADDEDYSDEDASDDDDEAADNQPAPSRSRIRREAV